MRRLRRVLAVVVVCLAVPLLAAAQSTGPTISLDPSRAEPGDWVSVRGESFPERARGDVAVGGQHVASFRADRDGAFTVRFRVPHLPDGLHEVTATAAGATAAATLRIGDPVTTPSPPPDEPPPADDPAGVEPVLVDRFDGATLFVDPHADAAQEAVRDPQNAGIWNRIADHAQADWLGDWSHDVEADARDRAAQIRAAGALPVFVAYAVPLRDCGHYSAGGANSPDGYRAWVRALASGLAGHEAVVILEPDAIAHLDCLTSEQRGTRLQLVGEAVDTLNAAGVAVYIDAGNSAWIDSATMAQRLTAAGIERARGFALNVSNFNRTADEIAYGRDLSARVGGKPFVVDTSRNGLGPSTDPRDDETWCNPPGRGLGTPPTAETGDDLVDAFLWIKRPGESDGTCKGGPQAGAWWPEYAFGLAERAPWAADGPGPAPGGLTAGIDHAFNGGPNGTRHLDVTVSLRRDGVAVTGARVVVDVAPDAGAARAFDVTTGSDGRASLSWRNAPSGASSFTISVRTVDGSPWAGEGGTAVAQR